MNIVDSDERDSTWEEHSSLFRVYFATVPDAAVRTVDVSDESREEAIAQSVRQQQMASLTHDAMTPRDTVN